jgi:hypothetical protein
MEFVAGAEVMDASFEKRIRISSNAILEAEHKAPDSYVAPLSLGLGFLS